MKTSASEPGVKVGEPMRMGHVEIGRTVAHPRNREFSQEGEEWEAFEGSVRERGVIQPLLTREVEDGKLQVIAGHRRRAAAVRVGLERVPVIVREMSDREALELLLLENLERENLDAVEEARAVMALMEDLSMSPEEVAARTKRSVEWVRSRQLVFELGDEAQRALRLPKDHDGHLHIGTVQLLLPLDAREREVALQMILHPEFDLRTLNVRQAADAIEEVIVKPRRAREAWDGQRERLGKEWRKRLRRLARPGTGDDVLVLVPPWEGDATGGQAAGSRAGRDRDAEDAVPLSECLPDAPAGLLWLHLAVRHGLAVRVVPCAVSGESAAVVDELVLRNAEASRGEEAWLASKRSRVISDQSSVISGRGEVDEKSGDERVQAAVDVMDGLGERSYDEGEAPEVVIEQVMEMQGVIDLGAVRRLREWAVAEIERMENVPGPIVPDWVPMWARMTFFEDTVEICDWVLSLKWRPGEGGGN